MSEITISPSHIKNWVIKYFDFKERKNGDELLIVNPFKGDGEYKFNISLSKAICNDWRSNEWVGYNPNTGRQNKCTFIRFARLYLESVRGSCSYLAALEDVLGSSSSAAAVLASQRLNKQLEKSQNAKEVPSLGIPAGAKDIDFTDKSIISRSVISWLRSRKITEDIVKRYKMMHANFDIIWPYYEFDELVYWQSRSRLNKEFLFPPESIGVSKGDFLFGFDFVEQASYITIVESILCCQTLRDQVIASGGAALTLKQAKKLQFLGPKDGVILAADNDSAGLRSILSNANLLKPFGFKLFCSIPPSIKYDSDDGVKSTKDWNDIARYTQEDPRKLFEENVKSLDIQTKLRIMTAIDKLKRHG